MTDRLFAIEEIPEVAILRAPRQSRGQHDARFRNDYPREWDRCHRCQGAGRFWEEVDRYDVREFNCPDCLGMGSVKARVRLEAGHRCIRCRHPYVPKNDAALLGVEASWRDGGWSACDRECSHRGPLRVTDDLGAVYEERDLDAGPIVGRGWQVEAAWRILTVHHADGDKANLAWWNLLALCQRCHLEIQAKVVMERVYPHEHSEWFRPFIAAYYAKVYLGEDLTRDETEARVDELLALERQVA